MNATTKPSRGALTRAAALTAATAAAVTVAGGVATAAPDTATKPGTPAAQLLVNSSDFPAGYIVIPSAQQRLRNEIGDPSTLLATAKVTPPACKNLLAVIQNADQAGEASVIAGINDTERKLLSESLLARDTDVTTVTGGLLKTCSNVDIQTNDPRGGTITAKVTTTKASSSDNSATLEVLIDGTRNTGTQTLPLKQKARIGVASLRGYTVSVVGATLGGDPDAGQVDALLTKSIAKIDTAQ